ncbi:hypothetical protein MRB53_006180 [Persea americana]|uniref:Uncharacterized protein n=1 Tax=Persea americana TaxID=3435 RepID=A0ACC2MGZ5_PERAE|nr:hypothetical protein MRB53_006180 [Persea americana]
MASKPVDDEDPILYILGGLGPEYGPFVTSISTRDTNTRLSYLHGLFLNEEIHVNGLQQDTQNIAANVATKSSSSSTSARGKLDARGRGHGRQGEHGRGQPNQRFNDHFGQSTNKPIFQVCNRMGHTAIQSYQRFNHAFVPNNVNPNAQYAARSYSSDLWYRDIGSTNHITPDLVNLMCTQSMLAMMQ